MKMLIAVLFAMNSVAFAGDVIWEEEWPSELVPWRSSPERSETAKESMPNKPNEKAQTQPNQYSTGNTPVINAQQKPKSQQSPNEQGSREVDPDEESFGGMKLVLGIITAVVAVIGLFFTVGKFCLDWKKDRPYLSAEWEMEELKVDQKIRGVVTITNGGNTPAILNVRALYCNFVFHIPVRFNPQPTLSEDIAGRELPPKAKLMWQFSTPHYGSIQKAQMEGRRGGPLYLYAAVYIGFNKRLWRKPNFVSEVIYDKGKLRPVDESDRKKNN